VEYKIISGGIYLVNLGKHKNPEFSSPHYCVIIKSYDKELLLCLPTTSKEKLTEKYIFKIPEDGSTCLFKHAKFISNKRILKPLYNKETGQQMILSNQHLNDLLQNFQRFMTITCNNALQGNKQSLESMQKQIA